ncbi:hypothetical protein EV382_1084 [Micromonospora violae]|uniref:Uncharacterized protein n=1 Tax=Micromonospora violae TaxID=1278207 RepID=A0A4Q7UEL5_9ACTN|nr:hypothetical protein [Micromonospora violae]RZT77909.1 hypothetical protein EV382_1084 [Micromonospora violae]
MPERPVARDDSAIEHQPPAELPRDPRASADDDAEARDADGVGDHTSHDPYQPL